MQGKLVRLRAFEKTDLDAILRWRTDEDVIRFLGPPELPVSRAGVERFIDDSARPSHDAKIFAIETVEGGLIGETGLRNIDWKSRKAEFIITIGERKLWDKGYGTDVVRTVTRLAFEKLNLNRVWLTVLAPNARAIRAYEKCGFKREGTLRQESYVDGKYLDAIVMGLIRTEYEPAST